ncbi:MAG: hypothetical protein LBK82_05410, partial [Planctomycetaceae bacterium]|nr:hypothetical protein [Planctomycetaceae bacterium]
MSNGVLLSKDLALRTKTFIEGLNAGDVKTPDKSIVSGFAGFVAPVELTTEWNNDDGNGWKAKMKRLWYQTETGEYHP